jgi:peptidyl-prolyl cis-trans isomerase B (cyclophilin B)
MLSLRFSRSLLLALMAGMLFFASTAPLQAQDEGRSKKEKMQLVKMTTPMGEMTIMLYNETPQHRDNFVKLVEEGFYNDLLFHRVIEGFMVQGGDPNSKGAEKGAQLGNGGPGYQIPAEFNEALIHKKGALSAARLGDGVNPEKKSSGSQFYIVQGKTYDDASLTSFADRMGKTYSDEQKAARAEGGLCRSRRYTPPGWRLHRVW